MKKFFALLILASMLCLSIILASCDVQETVDSARSNLMETSKELFDPFLNQTVLSDDEKIDDDKSNTENGGNNDGGNTENDDNNNGGNNDNGDETEMVLITFNGNDPQAIIFGKGTLEIPKGGTLTTANLPKASSIYIFICWAYDRNGENIWNEDDEFTEDTVLYAIWDKETGNVGTAE